MKKLSFLLLLLVTLAVGVSAQDKIYTSLQKPPIEGEVTEVTTNEIRYRPAGRPVPVVSIDKQDVIRIVYQNGEVLMINNPLDDYSLYAGQHKWNLKLSLLSPLLGHTQLFLERSLKPGRSVEYELNLIGAGLDQRLPYDFYAEERKMNALGGGIGIGLKFLRLPDYVNGQTRLRHIMQGSYIKPAISANVYKRNFPDMNGSMENRTVYAITPNLTLGKQWILDNTVSIEIYGLIGYSFDNVRSVQSKIYNDSGFLEYLDSTAPFNGFGHTRFGSRDFGLTLGGGIRVGLLFDTKKARSKSGNLR